MRALILSAAAAASLAACVPVPAPGGGGSGGATIPAAAQGRWGLTAADCDPTRSDAKGLMTVDATTLRFYESRGTLTSVVERSETRIVGNFSFTGEGQTWTRQEILDVQNGGTTLIRREYGDGAAPGPFQYTSCD